MYGLAWSLWNKLRGLAGRFGTGRREAGRSCGRARPPRPPALEPLEHRLCLAVDLLVSNPGGNRVLRYEGETGVLLGEFVPTGYGGINGSHGLTAGPDGNIYVASTESHQVLRYDAATGSYLDDFVPRHSGGLGRPVDVAFHGDHLYVSGAQSNNILRYDAYTGAFRGVFVPAGSGGLNGPHGMTFGPDGHLYVNSSVTHSVMRYDGETGAPLPAPGRTGAYFVAARGGELDTPWGQIAFGPDGNLYVAGFYSNAVHRFDVATGEFLGDFVPRGSGGLTNPHGIAFGPDGHLYVASHWTHKVLRYDGTTGEFLDEFIPSGGDGLNRPTYLYFWDTGLSPHAGHEDPEFPAVDSGLVVTLLQMSQDSRGPRRLNG